MRLYVLRHGQTDVNLMGLINARNDEDLNETGIRQAEEMGDRLQEVDYGLIISSPSTRAVHTAEIVNRAGVPVLTDDALLERDFGPYTKAPIDSMNREEMWKLDPEKELEGAETVREMTERIYRFLDSLKERYPDKNIVLVTHGGASKAISSYFEGIPEGCSLAAFRHGNCEIHEFSY